MHAVAKGAVEDAWEQHHINGSVEKSMGRAKNEVNLMEGSIAKGMFSFAIPMFLGQLIIDIQILYSMTVATPAK